MRAALFVISVMGCYSCFAGFVIEGRKGSLFPSLFFAGVAWLLAALAFLFAWRD